jgi:hypothetical protein
MEISGTPDSQSGFGYREGIMGLGGVIDRAVQKGRESRITWSNVARRCYSFQVGAQRSK